MPAGAAGSAGTFRPVGPVGPVGRGRLPVRLGRLAHALLRGLIAAAAVGNGLLVLLTLAAPAWWFADLAIHYRPQFVVFALALVPLAWLASGASWPRSSGSFRASSRASGRASGGPRASALLRVVAACALLAVVVCAGDAWRAFVASSPDRVDRGAIAAGGAAIAAGGQAVVAAAGQMVVPAAGQAIAADTQAVVPAAGAVTRHWRVALSNVFMHNARHDEVLQALDAQQPDAIVLMETGPEWASALSLWLRRYPSQVEVRDFDDRTVIVMSRWPLKDIRPLVAGVAHAADPVVTLRRADGDALRLAALHGTWPFSAARAARRNLEFDGVASAAQATALPFVAVGDLNCTPSSPHFQAMLRDGGLTDAGAGHGWMPTWPTWFEPLGIRIDHALVARARVGAVRTLDVPGSDHRGLVVDLDVPG